jgi:hypothetical protein
MNDTSETGVITSYGVSVPASSKPIFEELNWSSSRDHAVVVDGHGISALKRLLSAEGNPCLSTVTVFLGPGDSEAELTHEQVDGAKIFTFEEENELLDSFKVYLGSASIETHVYVAGVDAFIGKVAAVAYASGVAQDSLSAEETGPSLRAAQCVHCKGISQVKWRVFDCPFCNTTLSVRDHYSKRLGAYQAVMISAQEDELERLRAEAL